MRSLFCIALFILGAFQYTFWFGPNGYFALKQLAFEIESLQERNLKTLQRNLELRAEIAELRFSHALIEEIARRDLGMIASGETFYLVVNSSDKD